MKKLLSVLCDHCKTVNGYYKIDGSTITVNSKLIITKSKKKNTELHFCKQRCMLIFFKGKKYYNKKMTLIEKMHQNVGMA